MVFDDAMRSGGEAAPAVAPAEWPPQPPPVPREVQTAFRLWIANIVIGTVVGFVVGFVVGLSAARQRAHSGTAASVNTGAQVASVIGSVIGLAVIIALEVLVLVKMRKGRNWARIVLTVLAVLNVVGTANNFLHGQGLAVGIGLVSVLLLASATALMYRPPSNVYFKSPKWV